MRCLDLELAPWEIRCIRSMDLAQWSHSKKKNEGGEVTDGV